MEGMNKVFLPSALHPWAESTTEIGVNVSQASLEGLCLSLSLNLLHLKPSVAQLEHQKEQKREITGLQLHFNYFVGTNPA